MTSTEFWGSVDSKPGSEKRDVANFPLSFLLGDRTDHAFRSVLKKPTQGASNPGGHADLREVFSPAQLKDLFRDIRSEAEQMIQDVKSITP